MTITRTPLQELEKRLGHIFKDRDLLRRAVTWTNSGKAREIAAAQDWQRLEFLGDRVLGLVIADALLTRFPGEREGEIGQRHVACVRAETLTDVARALDLGRYILISEAAEAGGMRDHPGLLSDMMEVVIASLYIDGGLTVARDFILAHWAGLLDQKHLPSRDAKSALQEWASAGGLALPEYELTGQIGPDHAPEFTVRVQVTGQPPQSGVGPSKRQAEQQAAAAMLTVIRTGNTGGTGSTGDTE